MVICREQRLIKRDYMKESRKKFILLLLLILLCSNIYAGSISVQTGVDKSVIHIGDYIKYYIIVKYSKGIKLILQPPGANLGQFDIKDYNVVEIEKTKEGLLQKKIEYTITTYFLGEFEIPPVEIEYIDEKQNRGTVKSEPMIIKVVPVKRKPGDKDDIRDIKKPIYIKTYTWLYILIVILIFAIVSYFIYYYQQKRPGKEEELKEEKKKIPEDIEALNKIGELLNKGYLEDGQIKQFYFELSEIIREYLHRRYDIPTLERTSSEILKDLEKFIYGAELYKKFYNFFYECDMVKFAKYIPTKNQLKSIIPLAKELIEKTRRVINQNEIL